ncbi:MAG: hypothetical protein KAJ19_22325 [Gammaproteobacteria bacterium]|nr:hypothetical protein [Gammaproteobacteria bacterium]
MGAEDKYTPIVLDKPRRLLLDLNAMVDFEKATNKNIWSLGENFSATDLRALLWACLRHEDEELLPGDVGKMIHTGNMEMVGKALNDIYKKAMPEGGKGKKRPPLVPKRMRPTG